VLRERLAKHSFDCIMVGAGVRLIAQNTFLFEKLVNIVHAGAPQAKFCFNTVPADFASKPGVCAGRCSRRPLLVQDPPGGGCCGVFHWQRMMK
jgi:hypothetical protein